MGRYAIAIAILSLSTSLPSTTGFSLPYHHCRPQPFLCNPPQHTIHLTNRQRNALQRLTASITSDDYSSPDKSSSGDNDSLNTSASVTPFSSYNDSSDTIISDTTTKDDDDVTVARQQRRRKEMNKDASYLHDTYEVKLPLSKKSAISAAKTPAPSPIGLTVTRVQQGPSYSSTSVNSMVLNLDTLRFEPLQPLSDSDGPMKRVFWDREEFLLALDDEEDFDGVVVTSVVKGSLAWNAGVRVSDVLLATSATIGDQMWPKSTLDGVRSAISSRKVLNDDVTIRFAKFQAKYAASQVTEKFDLILRRPIGIEIKDGDNGFVEISAFTKDATTSTRSSLRIGDRITAVDSTLGSQMWPVSNVEGLMSSCTSRLPGQPIRFQFERVISVGDYDTSTMSENEDSGSDPALAGAVNGYRDASGVASGVATTNKNTHKLLLSRCRDVLRRYNPRTASGDATPVATPGDATRSAMSAVPTLVADRVLQTLGEARAPLDGKTLALIMNSYLSSRAARRAIQAFEVATGRRADGKVGQVSRDTSEKEKIGEGIPPSDDALTLFTGTALLRAHAINGDVTAASRVLTAMQPSSSRNEEAAEVASWPIEDWADTRCYNVVLAAAAKKGGREALNLAIDLFDSMAEPPRSTIGTQPIGTVSKSAVSYNTMIALFAKARRVNDALTVFYAMKEANLRPDKFTYTSVLKALVAVKDFNGAEELLQEMRSQGLKPDTVTYNTLIKGLCDSLLWYRAKNLVIEMETSSVRPNSVTYGLLMNGLLRADKPAACLTLFESAYSDERTSYLTENVYLYTTAITAASRMGDHDRALDLLTRMKSVGVKPNVKTLTALAGALAVAGKSDLAQEVFSQIQQGGRNGVKVDGVALGVGVRVRCDAGDWEGAAQIVTEQRSGWKEMSGKDVMYAYNYLIGGSLKAGKFDVARNAFNELLATGYIPSKILYKIMLQSLMLIRKKDKYGNFIEDDISNFNGEDRFSFLLFVMDVIRQRKLECDGGFYALTLQEGARLGGPRRMIASIMAGHRLDDTTVRRGMTISNDSDADHVKEMPVTTEWNWEQLLDHFVENKIDNRRAHGKNGAVTTHNYPMFKVRINDMNRRQVFMAEKTVSISSNKKRRNKKWNASSAAPAR